MNRRELITDAAIALIAAAVVLIVTPGLAIVLLVAVAALLGCLISGAVARRASR